MIQKFSPQSQRKLEDALLGRLADALQETTQIDGLLRLTRSGSGAVGILAPGADMDAVSAAVRRAMPGLGALVLLPDNGRDTPGG